LGSQLWIFWSTQGEPEVFLGVMQRSRQAAPALMSAHEAGISASGGSGEVAAMARRSRQSWAARLLAATLALALVVASIVGAAAHAGGHHHHLDDAHHGAMAVPDGSPAADRHSGDAPEPAHQHSGCLDFVCHGGLALLTAAIPWTVAAWPDRAVFPWDFESLASVSPARLDRPPKPLVSA
jgi:hypothetical protein